MLGEVGGFPLRPAVADRREGDRVNRWWQYFFSSQALEPKGGQDNP